MTKDDIIRMAQEASPKNHDRNIFFDMMIEDLERFAALVASAAQAKEREACANAMAYLVMTPTLTHGALVKLSDVVNAIRARGQA